MTYVVATPPTEEPITLAEACAHLKVDVGVEDVYINALITAARTHVENYIKRHLCTTVIEKRLDAFPTSIELIYGPFISIDSIIYVDTNGTNQTLATGEYEKDIYSMPARIKAVNTWPSTKVQLNAVKITYTAGYGDAEDVPQAIKHAMLLIIGRMYEQREDSVYKMPTASENLLLPYIVF